MRLPIRWDRSIRCWQVRAGCGKFLSQRGHVAHEAGAILDVLGKIAEVSEMTLDTRDGVVQSGAVGHHTPQMQAVGDDLAGHAESFGLECCVGEELVGAGKDAGGEVGVLRYLSRVASQIDGCRIRRPQRSGLGEINPQHQRIGVVEVERLAID